MTKYQLLSSPRYIALAYGLEKVKTRMGRELRVKVFFILLQLTILIWQKIINENNTTSLGYSYKELLKDKKLYWPQILF